MQIKKLFLIGFSALAMTAYGAVFASSHEDAAAMAKKEAQEKADAAQKVADDRQAEAEAAVKAGSADAGAKVSGAAAAEEVAAEKMKKASE